MPRRLTVPLLALVALAGCGGNDKKDAENTVREFIQATNHRDAKKLCEKLLSQSFIEQTTGANGDRARSACKQQFTALRPLNIRLVRISRTNVNGDKATVTTVIEQSNQPQPRVFRLTKENGSWRLAGGAGG